MGLQGGDMGRMAALDAGFDVRASGVTLDRFCGSGLTAASLAAAQVMSGMEDLVIAGTVNAVVDQILAFRDQIGDFGNLVYACHDWMDPALAKRSMELFANEVMPRVNQALR